MRKLVWSLPLVATIFWISAGVAQSSAAPMRIGSERAQGGLTVAEQAAQQRVLHDELSARLPVGADHAAPVRVGITQKDRDDLAVVPRSGTAPLLVGVV